MAESTATRRSSRPGPFPPSFISCVGMLEYAVPDCVGLSAARCGDRAKRQPCPPPQRSEEGEEGREFAKMAVAPTLFVAMRRRVRSRAFPNV